uniref:MAEBL family membrane protein n=1 Tax=Enterococcus faecalis TaxID=1351 RepID=UPI00046C5A92
VGCFFVFTQTSQVSAEEPKPDDNKVVVRPPTTDVDTIYNNYKDNSFQLMTQEKPKESLSGISEAIQNAGSILKNITWTGVKMMGLFNVAMVDLLFNMDIVSQVKKPILALTSSIASNMLGIAGTIGICMVALTMIVKFAIEQRFRRALITFGLAVLTFTGLAICKDANASNSFFNFLLDVDKTVETEFVKINPVLNSQDESLPTTEKVVKDGKEVEQDLSPEKRITSAGKLIGARIFYTNVYEPYLLLNYGTSNTEAIRKKTIKYKDTDYDRINILLDNDINKSENEKLHAEVTEYEADKLNNRTIQYYSSFINMFYALFYIVVNLIQTVVYFVLSFIRLIIAVLQLFLFPLLPILLLAGLFLPDTNIFKNFGKTFAMTVFMKAMAGFACIFFATFLSLGFQLSGQVNDPWKKLLTILIYLLTPLGLYLFRSFLGGLVTGKVSMADGASFVARPFSTERKVRGAAKERKAAAREQRKLAKEARKELKRKAKENKGKGPDTTVRPKPSRGSETKRSALRREAKPTPQHKAPNTVEKARQKAQDLHDQSRQADVAEKQQIAKKQQRKAFDKDNLQTAATLRAANEALRKDGQLPERRNPVNRQGNKVAEQPKNQLNARRNGQSKKPKRSPNRSTSPSDEKSLGERPTSSTPARSRHRVSGQKAPQGNVQPRPKSQSRVRHTSGQGATPTRARPAVRNKMAAVQQVVQPQATAPRTPLKPTTPQSVTAPQTRMAKRTAPPVKAPKQPKQGAIRRTRRGGPTPNVTPKAAPTGSKPTSPTKGMRQPRVRK